MHKETVKFQSLDETLTGILFLPESIHPSPVLIVSHGAGEFKENYFELCEFLAGYGIASFALDMHGHGESGGNRFHVEMHEWVADIRAAIDFLSTHAGVDANQIGAFGLSSGGTAILEAALIEPRLKFLVPLDATVRNSMPLPVTWIVQLLVLAGKTKKNLTKKGLRLPLAAMFSVMKVASDPEINRRLASNPRSREAFMAFPLPGAEEAFFVDTIKRTQKISAPTMVLWGEDDQLDTPKTARMLFDTLTCKKQLHIIPGNGHVGHLDRNRQKVFELTKDWILENTHESHEKAPTHSEFHEEKCS
ncbi:MAG: alpha/beta fold family hydrolase [Pedosphaera sp.]|nr:alpha/beta fold family hydrolase [Pedosphaera sp.]